MVTLWFLNIYIQICTAGCLLLEITNNSSKISGPQISNIKKKKNQGPLGCSYWKYLLLFSIKTTEEKKQLITLLSLITKAKLSTYSLSVIHVISMRCGATLEHLQHPNLVPVSPLLLQRERQRGGLSIQANWDGCCQDSPGILSAKKATSLVLLIKLCNLQVHHFLLHSLSTGFNIPLLHSKSTGGSAVKENVTKITQFSMYIVRLRTAEFIVS